jgi:glycosyltransferase involved in cell wall biosynthesis
MSKVSLCAIVKNEEKILASSLSSIKDLVDEIIIVDTGSTDKTIEIARQYTDQIHHFTWIDDFSAARNFCSQFAQHDYILRWDADFVLDASSLERALTYKSNDFANADLIYFTFNNEFTSENKSLISAPNFFIYRKELFHWESPIHNKLVLNDETVSPTTKYFADIQVNHFKDFVTKAHRYKQTKQLVQQELQKNPNNLYLQFLYAEGLMFDSNYEQAIETLLFFLHHSINEDPEKIVIAIEMLVYAYLKSNSLSMAKMILKKYESLFKTNPRFILTQADVTVLNDRSKAKELYIGFLTTKHMLSKSYSHNHERFEVHPYIMLGQIELLGRNNKKAITFFEQALHSTRLESTKQKLEILIKQNSIF